MATNKDLEALKQYIINCIEEDFPFKVKELPEDPEVEDIGKDAVRLTGVCTVGNSVFVYSIDTSDPRPVMQRIL